MLVCGILACEERSVRADVFDILVLRSLCRARAASGRGGAEC